MMYVKVYRREDDVLIAACDREILGKDFSEGDMRLNVSKKFYEGSLECVENLRDHLLQATIANLTGNKVVSHAEELGFIEEEHVLKVAGVKHAQFILF
ncbi:MAG: DUF424 family protein [Candidatus Altiarchaeota archaeon]|nr:DUF424 family protein [Candidatus Altiarchaeota archaeon]